MIDIRINCNRYARAITTANTFSIMKDELTLFQLIRKTEFRTLTKNEKMICLLLLGKFCELKNRAGCPITGFAALWVDDMDARKERKGASR